jgi:tetratricopeptide (TPR) repeat protein
MQSIISVWASWIACLFFSHAFGLTPKLPAPVSAPVSGVDQIRAYVATKKKGPASQLAQALRLQGLGQYSQASALLKKNFLDPDFGDHALWCHLGLLEKWAEAQPKMFKVLAGRALENLDQLQNLHPKSVFMKQVSERKADWELRLGLNEKDKAKKVNFFERSFSRKFLGIPFTTLHITATRDYASLCDFDPLSACTAWLRRLQAVYQKAPQDYSSVKLAFERLPPFRPEKQRDNNLVSVAYRAPDLDATALEEGIKAIKAKSFDDAIGIFTNALKAYPRSTYKKNFLFWSSEAHFLLGKEEVAKQLRQKIITDSPLSWFAVFTFHEEKAALENLYAADASRFKWKPRCDQLNYFELTHLDLAEKLLTEGLMENAALEIKELHVRDYWPSEFINYFMALCAMLKVFPEVWAGVAELLLRDPKLVQTPEIFGFVFPFEFWDQVKVACQANLVDPVLFLSLIKQESGFDARVVSSAGAVGLSQLMPTTAFEVDGSVGTMDLFQPEKNLLIGSRYLSKMLDKYGGNIALSLAAYNAGPQAVDRWVKEGRAADLLSFLEAIPYRETREYVATILRNYLWYSHYLQQDVKEGASFFWKVPSGKVDPKTLGSP